jgi:hypothetical protein
VGSIKAGEVYTLAFTRRLPGAQRLKSFREFPVGVLQRLDLDFEYLVQNS